MGSKGRSRPAAATSSSSSPCLEAPSDRLSPQKIKMASPGGSASAAAVPASPETQNVENMKSSLAFILTGNQECDQECDHDEELEEEEGEGHEYGNYQQEYTARHSSYETPGYSHQYSSHYERGHASPHDHHHQQQDHHYHQDHRHQHPQSQFRYAAPVPSGAFRAAPQMVPRPSFPLEIRPEPPRIQLENGRWAETQARKKVSFKVPAEVCQCLW